MSCLRDLDEQEFQVFRLNSTKVEHLEERSGGQRVVIDTFLVPDHSEVLQYTPRYSEYLREIGASLVYTHKEHRHWTARPTRDVIQDLTRQISRLQEQVYKLEEEQRKERKLMAHNLGSFVHDWADDYE